MLEDLRYAVRVLRRSPGFTLSAVAALALGIGANTAVFSVVYAVLLKPLPFAEPDRLVRIYETNLAQGIDRGDVSPGTYVDWRTRSHAFQHLASYFEPREWLLAFGENLEAVKGSIVTPSFFEALGVAPVLGRTFRPEAQWRAPYGDQDEVVIGYRVWQRYFGGSPDVLGRTIKLEGRVLRRVVGVMPPGFNFPDRSEIWGSEFLLRSIGPGERAARFRRVIGRLRPAVTIDAVRAELNEISRQLATEHPTSNAGYGADVVRLDTAIVGDVGVALVTFLGAVGCVLLIACVNVANLMVARATRRGHELAIRIALGAGIGRLLRQYAAETIILSAAGAVAGIALAAWGIPLLIALAPGDIPRIAEVSLDGRVLTFTAVLSILVAMLTGLVPALQARQVNVHDSLKTGVRVSGSSATTRRLLMAAEVALTVVLLTGSVLLMRSFIQLRQVDLGFDARHLLTADLRIPTGRHSDTRRPWYRLYLDYGRVLEGLSDLPSVEAVAGATGMPLTGEESAGMFWKADSQIARPTAEQQYQAAITIVTPGYFSTMSIPLLRGRGFSNADRLPEQALTDPSDAKPRGVVIVSDAFARRFFPGEDPIGHVLKLQYHWAVASSVIVGIVADVRARDVAVASEPAVYIPWGEVPGFRLSLAIRTTGSPSAVAAAVRGRLRDVDPQILVTNLRTMDDVIFAAVSRPLFNLVLIASFAVLALALAAIGIYAVAAYLAEQRTREIGIRRALGAQSRDVLMLVVGEVFGPVMAGAIAGVVCAILSASLIRTLLFGIVPNDAVSLVAAPLLLCTVALLASYVPTRRALRVDPMVALRDE